MADATVELPRPAPDELTAFFWEGCKEHRLLIQRCNACGTYVHWPRPVCRTCRSADLAPAEVSGRGTLYSWTVAEQAFHPAFLDRLPYVVATIALEEQADLRLVSNVVDCTEDDLTMDAPVQVTFREVAPDLVLPLFTLVPGGAR
jgi:uncharacterized OB-fold protein